MPTANKKKKTQKGTRTLKSRNGVKKFDSTGDKYTFWLAQRTELTLPERLKEFQKFFNLTRQRVWFYRKQRDWDRLHDEVWLPALWAKADEREAAVVEVMENEPPKEETLDVNKINTKLIRIVNLGLHINNDLISHCARMVKLYSLRMEKILTYASDAKFLDPPTKAELERCEVQIAKYTKMVHDFVTPGALKMYLDVLGLKETLFAEDKQGIHMTPAQLLRLAYEEDFSQVLMNPDMVQKQLDMEVARMSAQQGTFAIVLPDISPKTANHRKKLKPQNED